MVTKKLTFCNAQKFKISLPNAFTFSFLENKKFLIIKNSNKDFKFLIIPNFIYLTKSKNVCYFEFLSSKIKFFTNFLNFQKVLQHFLSVYDKKFKKYLIIKGLGFRIRHLSTLNSLELKLGFSNLIYVLIPLNINVICKKNLLTLESFNSVSIGNFVFLIKSLKYPDSYQGKGLWYKNEIQKLKPVKKT